MTPRIPPDRAGRSAPAGGAVRPVDPPSPPAAAGMTPVPAETSPRLAGTGPEPPQRLRVPAAAGQQAPEPGAGEAPGPGSTPEDRATQRKVWASRLAALGRARRNQRGQRPGPQVTGVRRAAPRPPGLPP